MPIVTRRAVIRSAGYLGLSAATGCAAHNGAEIGTPSTSSESAASLTGGAQFGPLDQILQEAVNRKGIPGVVACVGHEGQIVYRGVYGHRALVPSPEAETWTTRFDMASLTKPTITALSVMQLWEQGAFTLDAPVARILPAFGVAGKQSITIRQLLTHYSGLPPDVDLSTPWTGKIEAVQRAMNTRPDHPPGERFVYSDINYITLGLLVEKISGLPLDHYATQHILKPMGMTHSGFLPDPALIPHIAPTQYDEHHAVLRGVVHDPTARRMGGVAGHAGLFSDADDMAAYAQALLDRRAGRASSFPLKTETVVLMTTPQQPPGRQDQRGLGWDIATHFSSPRGDIFPVGSFGHTGFTGTSLWMDPVSSTFVLILTNRVHPDGTHGREIVQLRHDIATAAAKALNLTPSGGA